MLKQTNRTTVEIREDESAGLPSAEIRYTIASRGQDERFVACASLEPDVPAHGSIRSHSFDNDAVVVDVDSEGTIIRVEVLTYTHGPADLPELIEFAVKNDLDQLVTYIFTTMQLWIGIKSYIGIEDAVNHVLRPLKDRLWNKRTVSPDEERDLAWV